MARVASSPSIALCSPYVAVRELVFQKFSSRSSDSISYIQAKFKPHSQRSDTLEWNPEGQSLIN